MALPPGGILWARFIFCFAYECDSVYSIYLSCHGQDRCLKFYIPDKII